MPASRKSAAAVLIVDDEPQVLTALRDLLEDDYEVRTETSAALAIRDLQRDKDIAVVISDQRMPEMNGDAFLAQARELSPATTRLLITGYADLQAVIRAINDGKVFGYISKPWEPDHLKLTVHKAVESHHLTRELNEERALLQNLMDHLPDEVYFKDTDHCYLRVNRAKAKGLGLSNPKQAVGRTVGAFLGEDRAGQAEQEESEILRTGKAVIDKVERISYPDGRERWLSMTKAPVLGERGQILSLVCLARDVTERYRAQRTIAESERRHRSLYNRTPVMMISLDRHGRLLSVSDHWCKTLGYPRERCLGRRVAEFMTEKSGAQLESELLPQALRRAEVSEADCQFVSRDGQVLETLFSAVGERDHNGEISQALAVVIDVTEKSRLQSQLLQAQKMEAVGQLTGGLAHDFNNLLTVMVGNLELLEEALQPDSAPRVLASSALGAGLRGAELTHQLLAFSRRQVLEPRAVDLNLLVSGTAALLERTLGQQIQVTLTLGEDLWPVLADPSQVESALANLAINARDAMPAGGRLTIETANRRLDSAYVAQNRDASPGEYAMLAVTDSGTGIPSHLLSRVFEPFFTTKTDGRGTGLGLSMVYGFAKQSGGHVRIESEPGQGTTVRLFLPRTRDPAEAVHDVPLETERLGGGETILVVEDDDAVRKVAVLLLRELGYRVLEAANAREALAVVERGDPLDLLFTDVVMSGGMSGTDLARAACERRPGLKVLLTSGFAEQAEPRESHPGFRHGLLRKPYLRRDLARKIRDVLNGNGT